MKYVLLGLLVALLFMTLQITCIKSSAVLISDMTMTVMVELSSRHPFCKMHTDRGDIQRMLLQSDPRRIRQVPRESVMELEEVCMNQGSYGHEFRGGLGFIYPGTKWCGPGTAATTYDDLGAHTREDRCCREHDMCPDVLNVGECRRGLCNTGTFTRSHCECDARFRRCLQAANTETANTLGAIFYNVVQVTCFQERSPCSAHQRFEDFYYRSAHCPVEYRMAELYVPPNAGNLIQKILTHPYGLAHKFFPLTPAAAPASLLPPSVRGYDGRALNAREYNESPTLKQNFDQFTRRLGVKLASVGLAAVNIFREIVQSPRVVWNSFHAPVSPDLSDRQQLQRYQNSGSSGGFDPVNYYYQNSNSAPPPTAGYYYASPNYWHR